jgi:CPA1 family monovalent cation:H+ antiporter
MLAAPDTHTIQRLSLFLLIAVTIFAALAKRFKIPYPILLVLAGLGISLVPHVPRFPLEPTIFFTVFLPPLLYAAAWQANLRDLRLNIVSILMLATGLVGFTVLGVALFADRFIAALDFRSGFLLGAIVAATDAVAATSIARTLGIAPRITSILEGESLVNDASALLALEFGLALLLRGTAPTVAEGTLRLLWLVVGGAGLGILLGYLVTFIERWIEDGPLEMAVSVITPYVAYLAAEEFKASGVLAVVACGLFLSRRSNQFLSPSTRLEIASAWRALDFTLNGIVFLLIGLQLRDILSGIREYSPATLLLYGGIFSLILVTLRMVWVFPGSYVSVWIRRRILHQHATAPDKKSVFLVGWTGMRGVISLAAAFSLPLKLSNGEPFAQRNLILFLTFSIIFVTLVLQGLSLPWVIRLLGLSGNVELQQEELYARRIMIQSAIDALQSARAIAPTEDAHDIEDLLHTYRHRQEAAASIAADSNSRELAAPHQRRISLIREIAATERTTLQQLRDAETIGDDVHRHLERELDLTEARLASRV